MMRLTTTSVLYELWRHSFPMASTAARRQLPRLRILPSNHGHPAWSHHSITTARPITTGWSVRKDVPQSKTDEVEETEKIDLDIWKSVMRSQVAADSHRGGEAGAEGEDIVPEGIGEDASTLEATRELVSMWRLAGKLVPEQMSDAEVQELSVLTTKSSKKKYLKYLAIKESYKKTRKMKQEKKAAERTPRLDQRIQPGGIEDQDMEINEEGFRKIRSSFLLQFWGRNLDKVLGWSSIQAMKFGQPLVFDLSYEKTMSRREVENTVSQLIDVEAWNRRAVEPFHLHFCNLQPNGGYEKELLKRYGAETWDRLLITSTDRQHVDVFPRESLVYLTADSPNVLRTFDHSKVYIVGAMVDRSIQTGLSLANAKRLKLATARLPLDQFLNWEIGAKNLTLDQMIRILLTVKETGNWEQALDFVPKRKHGGFHQPEHPPKRDRNFPAARAISKLNNKRPDQDRQGTNYNARNKQSMFGQKDREGGLDSERQSGDRSFPRSHQDTDFTGGNKERSKDRKAESHVTRLASPGVTQIRTSLKSKLENRTGRNKKSWWKDE